MGDRYGWRPLPKSIKAADFSAILDHTDNEQDKSLIQSMYQIDTNVVPPVYVLLSTNNNDSGEDEQSKALRRALTEAAQDAHNKGALQASTSIAIETIHSFHYVYFTGYLSANRICD